MALYDICNPAEETLIDRFASDDIEVSDCCGITMWAGLLRPVADPDPAAAGALLLVCRRCVKDTVHNDDGEPEWTGILSADEVSARCPF